MRTAGVKSYSSNTWPPPNGSAPAEALPLLLAGPQTPKVPPPPQGAGRLRDEAAAAAAAASQPSPSSRDAAAGAAGCGGSALASSQAAGHVVGGRASLACLPLAHLSLCYWPRI